MVATETGVRVSVSSLKNEERVGGFYLVRNIRVKNSKLVTTQIVCWSPTEEGVLAHRQRVADATNAPKSTFYEVVKI